jgi:AAA domain
VAVLNSLHIRQYNKYYEEVRRIAVQTSGARQNALQMARKAKPRLLVCAPSNAAVDNIILKIMEDGFIDGQGQRYNPSIIRVGVGQSGNVRAVALETKVDSIFENHLDIGKLENSIAGYRVELTRITQDITKLRRTLAGSLCLVNTFSSFLPLTLSLLAQHQVECMPWRQPAAGPCRETGKFVSTKVPLTKRNVYFLSTTRIKVQRMKFRHLPNRAKPNFRLRPCQNTETMFPGSSNWWRVTFPSRRTWR